MKKRSERRKQCVLAVVRQSQKISPRRRPLPEGAERPKFNQLEMVCTFLQTHFGEDWCIQFRVIMVTDPQTYKQTHKQDWLQYTALLSLARSVNIDNYSTTSVS